MPIKRFLARAAARKERPRSLHRHRHAATASQVIIRRAMSMQRKMLLGAVAAASIAAIGFALFVAGQMSAGANRFESGRRISELEAANTRLLDSNAKLNDAYNSAATQLGIERGARKMLESQVVKLEDDRTRLMRDLALFDNLFPAKGSDGQPAIRSFRVEPVVAATPSTWRYRALVMRGGQATGSFKGEFRLLVRYRQNGGETEAATLETGNVTQTLEFQRYLRIEGLFQSPPGAVLLGATARVVQNGKLVAESEFRP